LKQFKRVIQIPIKNCGVTIPKVFLNFHKQYFQQTVLSILVLVSLHSTCFAQSPYKLDLNREAIIFGAGIGLTVLSFSLNDDIEPLTIDEINSLNRDNINSFDRRATINYSQTEGLYSDILLVTSILSPALLALSGEIENDFTTTVTMYFQTLLLAEAIPFVSKGITQRVRPFAYNDNAPLKDKQNRNAKRSFFSGHTTTAFAMAVFLSTVYSDYNPHSEWKTLVLATSLTLASAVGALRYSSGSHFPTDIITGAIVGSAIGYFIPFVHRKEESNLDVLFGINSNGSVINLQYKF